MRQPRRTLSDSIAAIGLCIYRIAVHPEDANLKSSHELAASAASGDVTRNDVIYQAIRVINRLYWLCIPLQLHTRDCPPTRGRTAISRKIMQSALFNIRKLGDCGIRVSGSTFNRFTHDRPISQSGRDIQRRWPDFSWDGEITHVSKVFYHTLTDF